MLSRWVKFQINSRNPTSQQWEPVHRFLVSRTLWEPQMIWGTWLELWFYAYLITAVLRYRWRAKSLNRGWLLCLAPTESMTLLVLTEVSHGFEPQIFSIWTQFWTRVRNSHSSFKHAHYLRHCRSKCRGRICAQESYFNHSFCFFYVNFRSTSSIKFPLCCKWQACDEVI
jgi:hypothetical protein